MKPFALAGLLCAALCGLCILYVDRPVEAYIAIHLLRYPDRTLFFNGLASPSLLSLPWACLYLAFYALCRAAGRRSGRHSELLLMLGIAIAVATAAKDELKWLFGRPWPYFWIKFGWYEFRPFIDSAYYGSFPSGHTTYIAAPMFVLWQRLPRYRLLYSALILLVMIGLVGAGHHFVSDVIAGLFLGLAAAAGTLSVWPNQRLQRLV